MDDAEDSKSRDLDLVLIGGEVFLHSALVRADVGIKRGRIAVLGDLKYMSARETIDVRHLQILPGVIDTQVHLREPGFEHQEDLATGTTAAVLGGVTAVFEMPNTKPTTTSRELLEDKLCRARGRVRCHVAFYVGATAENAEGLASLEREPGCCGVKVFMGSSTGSLLVGDDATLERVLKSGTRRVAVHAEDEARLIERKQLTAGGVEQHPLWRDEETALRATRRLLELARRCARRVHVLHVTTAEELELLSRHKDLASIEVTPQHLTLCAPDCYRRLGTLAQMNPPIRDERHREALWRAVVTGVVDVVGSDHAPHTLEEKDRPYPSSPSGMTGVQTLVPILLDHVHRGRLSLARFVDLTSARPAGLFRILGKGRIAAGFDADLTVVDLAARRRIENRWIASRCGWTPFDGMEVTGWPVMTILDGRVVMRNDELIGEPAGAILQFEDTASQS